MIRGELVDLRPLAAADLERAERVANDAEYNGPFGTFALEAPGELRRRFELDGYLNHDHGRLIVADTSWELCGFTSEVAALAAEKAFSSLKAPVRRINVANCPAPVSLPLEKAFYPTATTIARAALSMLGKHSTAFGDIDREDNFKGPY